VQISDKSLFRLVRAAEQLRHETEMDGGGQMRDGF
jgi:hypothetical protein